jgi:molybdenum cofactor cytidylyltransferase
MSQKPLPDLIMILVCDQPLLRPENLVGLLRKYKEVGKPIIASRYSEMPGVPVLFDKTYYDRLMALPDKEGAKKVILQNLLDVAQVPFPGGEIDLDTREDYKAFLGDNRE